jgi:hypothetical protein
MCNIILLSIFVRNITTGNLTNLYFYGRPQNPIFLKVLQPIKTLIAMRNETGNCLLRLWEHSYDWLSEEERHRMMRFAANTAAGTTRPFQNWLEETALNLIVDPRL